MATKADELRAILDDIEAKDIKESIESCLTAVSYTREGKAVEDTRTRMEAIKLVFAYRIGRPREAAAIEEQTNPVTKEQIIEKARGKRSYRQAMALHYRRMLEELEAIEDGA